MKTCTIREATLADLEQLAGILREFHEEGGRELDLQRTLAVVTGCIGNPGRDLLVAEFGGEPIGYAAVHYIPFPMVQGHEAYLSDFLIRREWRGRGVGRDLLEATERRARAHGCVRIMLNNRRTAESFVRGFYNKAGYRERDNFANFIKPLVK
jgi:GNAT superfamily N-acetyltransferase